MAPKSYIVFSFLLTTLLGASLGHKIPSQSDVSECIAARCDTLDELNKLWCHEDPTYYCVCKPGTDSNWELQVMPCSPETLFSFIHQECVAHLEERDRAACYYEDTPGDGSGSGSGDGSGSGSGSGDGIEWTMEMFNGQRFEGRLDEVIQDDVMEFLFPGREED